ncbi:MAG: hypothetical protein AAGD04_03480 [Pseudomonadota bacterium]
MSRSEQMTNLQKVRDLKAERAELLLARAQARRGSCSKALADWREEAEQVVIESGLALESAMAEARAQKDPQQQMRTIQSALHRQHQAEAHARQRVYQAKEDLASAETALVFARQDLARAEGQREAAQNLTSKVLAEERRSAEALAEEVASDDHGARMTRAQGS